MDKMKKADLDKAMDSATGAMELRVALKDGTTVAPRVSFLDPDQPMEVVITPVEGDPIVISPPLNVKILIGALMLFDELATIRELMKAKASDVIQVPTPQGVMKAKVGSVRPQMVQRFAQQVHEAFDVGPMTAEEVAKQWTKV